MFDDDDWNVDDDYLKDIDFDADLECNKNQQNKPNVLNPETIVSSKENTTSDKNELKTKNQVLIDDWNLVDEDYFKDFDVDEVLESLSNKNNHSQAPILKKNPETVESSSNFSRNEFQNNIFTNEVESISVDKISHKSAILDIFKNTNVNNDSKNSSNTGDKLPISVNSGSEFKNNINEKSKSTVIIESSSNKRKKSVAFSEFSSDKTTVKRVCVSSTSKENIFNICNENDSKKNSLLDWLESPAIKTKQAVIRKFPGPAGILPDDVDENGVIDLDSFEENKNTKNSVREICSQHTKNLFSSGAWQLMMDDLPADFKLYDISVVKENALEFSKTYKKVPYLAGIIQNIDHKPNDPHVILKDFSGKIDARIHHSICKLYPNALGTNVVMLLKDVGVIVTSKRYVYIIISPKSLVSAYSDDIRLIKTPHLEKLLDKNCSVDLLLEQ